MFSKTADPTSAPPIPAPPGGSNVGPSVLGRSEDHRRDRLLRLGRGPGRRSTATSPPNPDHRQEGRVSGAVRAHSIEVKGRLDGKVDSESFTMRASAQVVADVTYATLVIESGAQIEGRFSSPKA
jgi:hypothetical protein